MLTELHDVKSSLWILNLSLNSENIWWQSSIMHLWVRALVPDSVAFPRDEPVRPFPSCIYEFLRPFPSAHWSLRPLPSCIFPRGEAVRPFPIMHLWVPETISICALVPETVVIMHFSSRWGRETISNHHAFFPRDGLFVSLHC